MNCKVRYELSDIKNLFSNGQEMDYALALQSIADSKVDIKDKLYYGSIVLFHMSCELKYASEQLDPEKLSNIKQRAKPLKKQLEKQSAEVLSVFDEKDHTIGFLALVGFNFGQKDDDNFQLLKTAFNKDRSNSEYINLRVAGFDFLKNPDVVALIRESSMHGKLKESFEDYLNKLKGIISVPVNHNSNSGGI